MSEPTETTQAAFKPGDDVRVRPDIIPRLISSAKRTAEGRVAVVLGVFTPMGSNRATARIQWRYKRTGKPTRLIEFWPARDLELVKPSPT
jgi:hypothetical protein